MSIIDTSGAAGEYNSILYNPATAGTYLVHNGINGTWYSPSVEEQSAQDEYRRNKEISEAEHKEKLEALKTIFPRGYDPVENFDIMIDIARDDQLNPLYEETLKNFEEAQANLHRAARKLASAVKLVDSELVAEKAKGKLDAVYWKTFMNGATLNTSINHGSIYPSTHTYGTTTTSIQPTLTSMVGPTGPMGPQGNTGPAGKDAVVDESLIKRLIRKVMGESK